MLYSAAGARREAIQFNSQPVFQSLDRIPSECHLYPVKHSVKSYSLPLKVVYSKRLFFPYIPNQNLPSFPFERCSFISPAALITLQLSFHLVVEYIFGLIFFLEHGQMGLKKYIHKMFSNHHGFLSAQNASHLLYATYLDISRHTTLCFYLFVPYMYVLIFSILDT